MHKIWLSVASTTVTRGASLVIAAVSVMVMARWLGPPGQGIVATVTSWAALFASLASLSLGQAAMHRATRRRGENWLPESLGSLLFLDLLFSAACMAAAVAMYLTTGGRLFRNLSGPALIFGLLLIPFMLWDLYAMNLLPAVNELQLYNRAQLIGRLLGLIIMGVAWFSGWGVYWALAAMLLVQVITAIIGLRRLWRRSDTRPRIDRGAIRELVVTGMKLHMNAIGSFVFSYLPVVVINYHRGPAEAGLYQFTTSLMNVIMVIPLAASDVIWTRVTQLGPEGAWVFHREVVMWLTGGMILIAVVAAAAAPWAIPLVGGERYLPAVPLFRLSLLTIVGMTLAGVMGAQWIGRGLFWQMGLLTAAVAASHAVATLLFVPRYGMYGAVYANLITYGIAIIGNGTLALRCEMQFRSRGEGPKAAAIPVNRS